MRSKLWKFLFRHPTNVFLAGILWGTLFVAIGLYATRDVTNGLQVAGHVPPWIGLTCMLFFVVVFVRGIVLLLTARFFAAFCYLVTGCMMYMPLFALLWLKGDRFTFTSGPHREIADIYDRSQTTLIAAANFNPLLVPLENQCHPPPDCQCWIVLDPGHTTGVERDIGGWHRPGTYILPADETPVHFAIVDVRRINVDVYSVLGCVADWTSLKPL
jgi:hypothetical protein